MRKTITWVSLALLRSGGGWYGKISRKVLEPFFEVSLKDVSFSSLRYKAFRYIKPFALVFNLVFLWCKKAQDIWMYDDIAAALVPFFAKGKNILVTYHVDPSVWPVWQRALYWVLEKYIYWNIRRLDAIVTISTYWQDHFLNKGCKNVYKIYCPFSIKEFNLTDEEVAQFKKKFCFENKPIVYLGNCQREKGVVEAYEALKDLNVHLVTSGEPMVRLPALNLNLSHREYLCLLKVSAVVVTMSKFKEGWCITAHEAMLLQTPVIGSGLGGMRELLEGGNQTICENFSELRGKVEYLLQDQELRESMGKKGYEYAKNFSLERFEDEWISLIENHIDKQ